jgi:hypothetical protein
LDFDTPVRRETSIGPIPVASRSTTRRSTATSNRFVIAAPLSWGVATIPWAWAVPGDVKFRKHRDLRSIHRRRADPRNIGLPLAT